MGSKSSASLAFFLLLNILFFALVTACDTCPKPKPKPKPKPSACPPPTPSPKVPSPSPKVPSPSPKVPSPSPKVPSPSPKVPSPSPNVPSPSPPKATCPKDTLKLGACADLLGLVNVVVGSPSETPCCSLLQGLTDLEAAICLCTAIKANILGINLNVPVSLSLLLNACEKEAPSGFHCE